MMQQICMLLVFVKMSTFTQVTVDKSLIYYVTATTKASLLLLIVLKMRGSLMHS